MAATWQGRAYGCASSVETESRLGPGDRAWSATFAVWIVLAPLTLLAAVNLAAAVGMIFYPQQLDYGESIVYTHAARLLSGQPLYHDPSLPPYTIAIYTPLFYWLAGALQGAFGPGFWSGRAVSFLAALVCAGLVARLATERAGGRLWGALAAALFLALGYPPYSVWAGLYRVDLPGVALGLGAIAILGGQLTARRVGLAALLAALALLTKQTLFAATLAGGLWLWSRNRRLAISFVAIVAGTVLTAGLLLELFGGSFLASTVWSNVNPFGGAALGHNLLVFSLFQGGQTIVICLTLLRRRETGSRLRDDLLALFWLASLLPLLGLAKVGAAHNYWLETAAVGAVLVARGLWEARPRARLVLLTLLCLSLSSGMYFVVERAGPAIARLGPNPSSSASFFQLVERVREERGMVLADPADVAVLAGRPIVLEPYVYSLFEVAGLWDATPLVRDVEAGEVSLLVLDFPIDGPLPPTLGSAPSWPPSVIAALRRTMVLEGQQAGRYLYRPRAQGEVIDGQS